MLGWGNFAVSRFVEKVQGLCNIRRCICGPYSGRPSSPWMMVNRDEGKANWSRDQAMNPEEHWAILGE